MGAVRQHGGFINVAPSIRQKTAPDQAMLDSLLLAQCGVLSRAQALAAGVSRGAIRARLRSGHWQTMVAGVYATFSGEPPRMSRLWAAVLGAGDGAMLSHETAAELHGFGSDQTIHVTVPHGRRVVAMPGVVVHRSRDAARLRHPARQPPQTRVEETILDLAQTARDIEDAYGWIARGVGAGLTTAARLLRALALRSRVRRRRLIEEGLGHVRAGCRSVLELRYRNQVELAHGLPEGGRQVRVTRGGRRNYLDVLYRGFRLNVELDGEAAHPYHERFRDKRRDNAGVLDGIDSLRYGTADVLKRPCEIAAEVAMVLRRNGWPGTPRPCRDPACSLRLG